MSELDDIVAAAGIVIVDTPTLGHRGNADNVGSTNNSAGPSRQEVVAGCMGGSGDSLATLPQVAALEAMFSHRYTMGDPDFVQATRESELNSQPPCVTDFREKRQRDHFNRNRDWHGRGGGGGWSRGGGGGWGRGGGGYNRHDNYNRQSYRDRGDDYNRNSYNRHRDGGDGSRGHHQYQDGYGDRERR